jgi:putative ABC transport system permease protein
VAGAAIIRIGRNGTEPTDQTMVGMQTWDVDYDYVKTMGMKIIEGRDFSADFLSDSSGIIMNQSALKFFHLKRIPLVQKISTFDGNNPDGSPDKIH